MASREPLDVDATVRLEALLARSGARDRASIERHLAACDAEGDPAHGQLWRRLISSLAALAPLPAQMSGSQAVTFFIPDGKYRMQVFALEDRRDGVIVIYLPDVLQDAVKAKILAPSGEDYCLAGARKQVLRVRPLDTGDPAGAPPTYVKPMLGWNRKAIRITLPTGDADSPQVSAAEALCTLAAKKWMAPAAPVG